MTTLDAMRDALATLGAADLLAAEWLADAAPAPDPDPFVPELPPATAPHGSRAAREVAEQLAEDGAHSHLVAYGETACVSGHCGAGLDALRGLL